MDLQGQINILIDTIARQIKKIEGLEEFVKHQAKRIDTLENHVAAHETCLDLNLKLLK